ERAVRPGEREPRVELARAPRGREAVARQSLLLERDREVGPRGRVRRVKLDRAFVEGDRLLVVARGVVLLALVDERLRFGSHVAARAQGEDRAGDEDDAEDDEGEPLVAPAPAPRGQRTGEGDSVRVARARVVRESARDD